MLIRLFHLLFSFFLLLLLADCAKIGSPAGGPRDETPPIILKSKPLNRSVQFEGKSIEITFDEYIRTDELRQELVVSPPFEERPEIRMKGKTLVIEWEEELRDSTTYTFSFGEAIKDLNEGNIMRNFEFVFSTGEYLDSLAVIGRVLKAFDLLPHEEKVFLLLYENHSDSAPLLEVPDYVGIADPNGNFLINNLRAASYRLFALQDQNRNLKYDIPEEYIGFLDSAIYLHPSLFSILADTLDDSLSDSLAYLLGDALSDSLAYLLGDTLSDSLADSLGDKPEEDLPGEAVLGSEPADSMILALQDSSDFSMADSVLLEIDDSLTLEDLAPHSVFVDIFLFQENNMPQYLIENTRKDRRKMTMRFNQEVRDTVIIEPYNFEASEDWYLFEQHIMQDTFVYWITDSLIYNNDSLQLLATYQVTDSLMNLVPFNDTLKFYYREPAKKTTRKKKEVEETEEKEETISVTLIRTGAGEQDLHIPLTMEIQHPVSEINRSLISLVIIQDSLEIPVEYELVRHPVKLRKYYMKVKWEGITVYKLTFYPGAFTDIYGLTNDTIPSQFRTRDPEYYGRILLNLSGVMGPTVIQLLNNKGAIVNQKRIGEDGLIEFNYLPPETFTLKLIHDNNNNGEWDTGDYLEHLQPEEVLLHPGSISVRSNFDMEVNWEIQVVDKSEKPNPSGEEISGEGLPED